MQDTKMNVLERKALISNVQKYNMHDGPGMRTLVFMKGCPLRCKWCANPEGMERKYKVMFQKNACVGCGACVDVCPVGIHTISASGEHIVDRGKNCTGCRKCVDACIESALSISGEMKTISELLEIIEEDRTFYQTSGGGVTIGGGDPLLQHEGTINILSACKQVGINTAVETSGYAKLDVILKVAEVTDLFLFDIKKIDSDEHYKLTGVRNEQILINLTELLNKRKNVKIRMPLLKGLNAEEKDIKATIEFLKPFKDRPNFKGVDLLPYHKYGINKYHQLDMEYPLEDSFDPSLSDEDLKEIKNWFDEAGIEAYAMKH